MGFSDLCNEKDLSSKENFGVHFNKKNNQSFDIFNQGIGNLMSAGSLFSIYKNAVSEYDLISLVVVG